MLEALGWTVAGVDLSLGQLRHARAQLPVVAGNGATLPIAGESLDVAVATSSTPTWATGPPSWPRPAGCYGQGGSVTFTGPGLGVGIRPRSGCGTAP